MSPWSTHHTQAGMGDIPPCRPCPPGAAAQHPHPRHCHPVPADPSCPHLSPPILTVAQVGPVSGASRTWAFQQLTQPAWSRVFTTALGALLERLSHAVLSSRRLGSWTTASPRPPTLPPSPRSFLQLSRMEMTFCIFTLSIMSSFYTTLFR